MHKQIEPPDKGGAPAFREKYGKFRENALTILVY